MGTEYDATYGRDRGFTNVQAFLDDGGTQHKQAGEASENQVHQMRLGDGQVVPRHDEARLALLFFF